MKNLTAQLMLKALKALDRQITGSVTLIVGGGGAMILAHHFPLATSDLDAVPVGMDLSEIDKAVKQVARDLSLAPDWLNPYYSTFSHVLPGDYADRLIEVFAGKNIKARALGKEEMLVMKCFAHRQKDVSHAKALIKLGANTDFVENHLEKLKEKGIPGSEDALEFLDELRERS